MSVNKIHSDFIAGCSILFIALHLIQCSNNPYGTFDKGKTVYSALSGPIRTLDSTRVSDTTSNSIASNIHDTPYEYEYLKRPLTLKPSMATSMPRYGESIINGVRYPTFIFSIKRGLHFDNDVCFENGKGREILIDDFMFAIQRAADPKLEGFGMAMLTGKVLGFDEFSKNPDYSKMISGVRKLNSYTMELVLLHEFPQIIYFFTIPASSPVPKECANFYNGKNGRATLDRHPIASGPYRLKHYHVGYELILERNPNYRQDDFYPAQGSDEDKKNGLLVHAGKALPLTDKFHFQMINTSPPRWTLFEQGYLDRVGIPTEVYDQVIDNGELSGAFSKRGVTLETEEDLSTFWWYFNMNDPVVGKNRELRQALSLLLDRQEMIRRFLNNRAIHAHGLVPPGLEGHENHFNVYANYNLEEAKRLLAKAGYAGGIDPKTKRPLRLMLTLVSSPGSSSLYRFYIDSFATANVELVIEQLDWPAVIEKKIKKNFQMIHGGWHADYPDPQNFMQLAYGPNSDNTFNENSYRNAEFDRLYESLRVSSDPDTRKSILTQMNRIIADDAPFIMLYHPISYTLTHKWIAKGKTNPLGSNQLKFRDVNPDVREFSVREWNRVPFALYLFVFVATVALAIWIYMLIKNHIKSLA